MIKENILNFTAVASMFILTGSSANAEYYLPQVSDTRVQYITKLVQPVSPKTMTQLDELDKIILHYEGEQKILEAQESLEAAKQQTIYMKEWAEGNLYIQNQKRIDELLSEVTEQVGVTPYGLGDTPEVWDCSGLTKWYLQGREIDVEHSATWQVLNGTKVQEPIPGDLVGFTRETESDYFHIGVYLGGGVMVHASNPEKGTNIQSIQEFADIENSSIVFVRY